MTKAERRKAIVKRVAARKIRATWDRKRAARDRMPNEPLEDIEGSPGADSELDDLPDTLLG